LDTWTPDWVARHFAVSLIPSIATFTVDRSARYTTPRQILAAGNPIGSAADALYADDACWAALGKPAGEQMVGPAPGAEEELAGVLRLAGPRAALLAQHDFVPERLRGLHLRDYGLVIFATHGLKETSVLPARLLMSSRDLGATTLPASLTANELVQLEFDADLIIMSACNSAFNIGGEFNGLVSGLLRAGARQVVATGWPVGAEIADIVTLPVVQHYLQSGATNFDRALQIALRNTFDTNSPFRHPHFWAGIVLVGWSYRS
jgi:CHAT domain-containing protein